MNLAIFVVIIAALTLGVILFLSVKQTFLSRRSANLIGTIHPIDVEAFRNLTSPAEDDYLRRSLTASQFRRVRRERLRAVVAYIHVVAENAGVLVAVGESALASGDRRLAEPAQALVNDALLLRRNATAAMARIYIALAWPSSGFAAIRVADRYEQLSGAAMLLGRLQNPAMPVRLSAMR
jgi:hypothetical protein